MDPQLLMAGASIVGKALTPAAAGPSSANPINEIGIDFSNWTVATGKSTATAANDKTTSTLPNWAPIAGMVLLAVVALKWISKK